MDRFNYDFGTPQNAMIIATSKLASDHSHDYLLFNEESIFPMTKITSMKVDTLRSDLGFFEIAAGAAVFSFGSIKYE